MAQQLVIFHYCMGILSSPALMVGPFLGLVAIAVLIASGLGQQWFGCAVLQGRHGGGPPELIVG